MFQNSSEYSFHLKSYPAACFHLDDAEYLRRRNEMLEFLFSNFGINRKMLIRLILAYPKFFNNEVEEISTKLELLKNLYVSMGGKNFKVFGRTQLGNGFLMESFVCRKDFFDLSKIHHQHRMSLSSKNRRKWLISWILWRKPVYHPKKRWKSSLKWQESYRIWHWKT